jgi:hypothetical protein
MMAASAQTAPAATSLGQLFENTRKAVVRLELDRDAYLAGEEIHLTVRVSNYTSEPLEVFDPFDWHSGYFDLGLVRTPPETGCKFWPKETGFEEDHIPPKGPGVPLRPGQSTVRQVDYEHFVEYSDMDHPPHFAPHDAGRYCLRYTYPAQGGAFPMDGGPRGIPTADFDVVAPKLERLAKVRVHGEMVEYNGKLHEEERYALALVVAALDKHIVCVPAVKISGEGYDVENAERAPGSADLARTFGACRRLAESDVPIESLQIAADNEDNITVSWTPAGGAPRSVRKAHDEWQLPPKPAPKEEPDAGKDEK